MADPLEGLRKAQTIGADPSMDISNWKMGVLPVGPGEAAGALEGLTSGWKALVDNLMQNNPAYRAAYEKAMASQLAETAGAQEAAQASKYAQQAETHDALLDALVGRPRAIPTSTGWDIPIPKDVGVPPTAGSGPAARLGQAPSTSVVNRAAPGFESKFEGASEAEKAALEAAKVKATAPRLVKKAK